MSQMRLYQYLHIYFNRRYSSLTCLINDSMVERKYLFNNVSPLDPTLIQQGN